jgi:hypothetical protein
MPFRIVMAGGKNDASAQRRSVIFARFELREIRFNSVAHWQLTPTLSLARLQQSFAAAFVPSTTSVAQLNAQPCVFQQFYGHDAAPSFRAVAGSAGRVHRCIPRAGSLGAGVFAAVAALFAGRARVPLLARRRLLVQRAVGGAE